MQLTRLVPFVACLIGLGLAKHHRNVTRNELEVESSVEYEQDDEMKLVCYYGSWAVYRPGNGKFPVEEIDPFLCSHIIYGFAGLSHDNKIRPLDSYNDLKENWGKGAFQRFTGLKQINKKLKTLIAIGGWNEGSVKYSNMAANPESRRTFVQSVLAFLERYDFDGLDFDWEYPGSRGGKPEDKRNFVTLIRELKEAFRPKNYLLTAAVSAGKFFIEPAYDIPQVAKYLDLINVMCYDYHGGWETKTGHNAPLYPRPDEYDDDRILNVNYSINYWISKGAPRNKIVLGMGSYGRSFALRRAEEHGIGAEAPQKGQAGPYTREGGSLGYNEICEMKKKNSNIETVWDPYYLAPYSYWGRQWVGYDSVESITLKAQYAKAMGLAGGMVWSIETDDFRGLCGEGKYPLLNAIKRVFLSPGIPELPMPNADPPTDDTNETPSSTRPSPRPTTRPTTRSTTRRPITMPPTRTPATISTTTRRQTEPTTRPATRFPVTRPSSPSSTSSSTTSSPSTPNSEGTTSSWWPHKSSTWWPQKPSTWWPQKPTSSIQPSSEVWWSSTTSTTTRKPDGVNSIAEETTSKPGATPIERDFTCYETGLYRDPNECTKFIRCVETRIEGQFQLFFHECPQKTVFNNETKLCDWVENVPECISSVPQYYLRGNFQTNH